MKKRTMKLNITRGQLGETALTRPPLPVLTSLRFFAAAEVVTFHEVYTLPEIPTCIRDLTSAGYESVTFFFVLSGFILTYVYADYTGPATAFWRARVARIF